MKYSFTHKLAPLVHVEDIEDVPFRVGWRSEEPYSYTKLPARVSTFEVAPDIRIEVYVLKNQNYMYYFRELLIDPETKEVLVYGSPITSLGHRSTITRWISTYYKKTSKARLWVEDRRRELTNQTTPAGVTI